jgi:hypothetical protein
MRKTCLGCGNEFETEFSFQQRCKRRCGRTSAEKNRTRSIRRDTHDITFVGVDGEGINKPDGSHWYVLLSVGDKSLHKDGARLTWEDIFPFLYEQFLANPTAAYVGYFLGYDFTQWLRDLPENRARYLLDEQYIAKRQRVLSGGNTVPFPVEYQGWEFDIHAGKRFKLRRRNSKSWMYICDAGPFFQTSFVNAINPKDWSEPIVSDEEYGIIVAGKEHREDAQLDDAMIRYNVTENAALAKLMTKLNKGFVGIDVRLSRNQWYGPGQAASEWMNDIRAPLGESVRDIVPREALEAARCTYFGGWFEIFAHGIIPGSSYEYDINSAYPYVISTLPCLLHGDWYHYFGKPPDLVEGDYRLVHAKVRGNDPWVGTMLHRTHKGSVLRPYKTIGWYWWHELVAAKKAGLISWWQIDETWNYKPCTCPSPYRSIIDLYSNRLRIGKNTPQGKAFKLVYNSAYGKTAQSIGNPKFSNSVYASLITAGCRTMILDAIATHPKGTADLLMVATDGIYFRTPHPNLPLDSEQLGKWDTETKENLTLFMPGMYWDDATRKAIKEGIQPNFKSRGISARDLAEQIANIDEQFRRYRPMEEHPTLEVPIRFNMVSAKQALARDKWETCGVVIHNKTRNISANPRTKRLVWLREVGDIWKSDVWHQDPYSSSETYVESTPYDKRFGMEWEALQLEDEMITPDGTVISELREALDLN